MELIELLAMQEGEKLSLHMVKSIEEIDCIDMEEKRIWFTDNSAVSWEGDVRKGFVITYDSICGWSNIYTTKRGRIQSIEMQYVS